MYLGDAFVRSFSSPKKLLAQYAGDTYKYNQNPWEFRIFCVNAPQNIIQIVGDNLESDSLISSTSRRPSIVVKRSHLIYFA